MAIISVNKNDKDFVPTLKWCCDVNPNFKVLNDVEIKAIHMPDTDMSSLVFSPMNSKDSIVFRVPDAWFNDWLASSLRHQF